MPPYTYQVGETISIALDAVSGDPAIVSIVTAHLKAVPPGRTTVPASAPIAATFAVASRTAQGEMPPGWTLTIPANVSATLTPGAYLADARLIVGGGTVITDTVAVRLRAGVTT